MLPTAVMLMMLRNLKSDQDDVEYDEGGDYGFLCMAMMMMYYGDDGGV